MNERVEAGSPVIVDPHLFSDAAVPAETKALNAEILQRLSAAPDMWSFSPAEVRASRAAGRGSYPLYPPDPDAQLIEIAGPAGPLPLRVMRPKTRPERGVYLHFHGGGWVMGTPQENDRRLRRLAENTGLATISADYRLAPEAPYPAAPDDCEAAALWLLSDAAQDFDRSFIAVGGESAGAHLSMVTMLRLRDRHGLKPFGAANLVAGLYDLAMTPSVRRWGKEKLILNTRDVANFIERFLSAGGDRADPDISPLQADLSGLPPALVTCGTRDLLIDETLFLAARLASCGNRVELAVYPGGCHVFQSFPCEQGEASLRQMDDFLNAAMAARRD